MKWKNTACSQDVDSIGVTVTGHVRWCIDVSTFTMTTGKFLVGSKYYKRTSTQAGLTRTGMYTQYHTYHTSYLVGVVVEQHQYDAAAKERSLLSILI